MKAFSLKKLAALVLVAVLALTSVFVLTPSAEEGEAAYISDGLVAWYDGVDNEANGTHNNDATIWQNKANPTEEWAINLTPDADDHFTDTGFTVHDNRQFFPDSVVDVINGEAWTLEVSLGDFVGLGKAYNTFINCDNDNFSLFIRMDTGCLEFKYAGLTRDYRFELPNGVELIKNSTVTITYEPGGYLITYINGEEVDFRGVDHFMNADNLFFGHDKLDRNQDTTFECIRIYDRVLNEHEVAYNYAVSQGTATGPYEEPTEAPTEAPTETPTEEPTEEATTEEPTEETTEAATVEETTEAPTETEDATVEATEAPTAAETEAATAEATEEATTTAEKSGCGASIAISALAILGVGAVLCYKRKEN